MTSATYNPEFFEPKSMEHARDIVLMYHEMSAEARWVPETEWIRDLLTSMRSINEDSIILDWGTGVGRIAKMLIETFGCHVVGVDINKKMLEYAQKNVNSNQFTVLTHEEFVKKQFREHFTHATATWVLQHSPKSHIEIAMIQQALKTRGNFFVLDMHWKCIPRKTDAGDQYANEFYDDRVSNRKELERWFTPIAIGKMPESITVPSIVDISWWGFLERMPK